MDAIDRKLLTLLQADSRQTADQLSARLNLSPSSITRRIQRLRSNGSIAADVIVLGDRLRARRMNAVINIQLGRHEPAEAEKFRQAFKSVPEVQVCVEITGGSDVLLIVSVQDMERFNAFADELATMPLVRRYETSFIKRTIKFTTATPLEDERDSERV